MLKNRHTHTKDFVMPRSRGYGDVTATYIHKSEIPSRIYTKHQYSQESEYGSTWWIIHSNIWVQLHSYHQMWQRLQEYYIIDRRKCENTKRCASMNSTKGGSKSLQKNSRAEQGGLEGWGSGRSADNPRYRCASQVSSWENSHAPSSMTWTWGSRGVKTPLMSGDVNAKWRA